MDVKLGNWQDYPVIREQKTMTLKISQIGGSQNF